MIKLSVIIVLYNEFELVKKCLMSVYKQGISDMEIILSDNSTDKNGHKKILKKFPGIIYVANEDDLGFAGGVNAGIKKANGEFILVLTPDMYLLPGTIKKTLNYLKKHLRVGIVGCRIYSSSELQTQSAVLNYPNLLTQLYYYNMPFYKFVRRFQRDFNPMYFTIHDHKKIQLPKAIGGEYMLIRKKAVSEINYFDPRFFLYFEDMDLCKRLIERGWEVVYLPVGGVVQNGMSGWKKTRITQALPEYMLSNYKFFRKHYGKPYVTTAWFIGFLSALVSIPYLAGVSYVRKLFRQSSQSQELLPLWIGIIKWHLTEGVRILFK